MREGVMRAVGEEVVMRAQGCGYFRLGCGFDALACDYTSSELHVCCTVHCRSDIYDYVCAGKFNMI